MIRVSKVSVSVYLLWALFLNGCFMWTTKDDGELLKQDVQHLSDRMKKIETDAGKERKELASMIVRAQKQVRDMEDTLSKATRVLARNSADFGAEMEELKHDIALSKGQAAELLNNFEVLQKQLEKSNKKIVDFAMAAGLDLPVDEASVPKDEKGHFSKIKGSLSASRFGEARSYARLYFKKYPKSKNLDKVQLIVGKSYMQQKRYAKALGALRRFVDVYPKSSHIPEALYEMANAFFMLGDCTDANVLADTIISRHGKTLFAAKAQKLKDLMISKKTRCTS